MPLVEIERHAKGPRVRVAGQRVHHGAAGLVLVVVGRRHRRVLVAGLVLAVLDAHDWRAWLRPGPQR